MNQKKLLQKLLKQLLKLQKVKKEEKNALVQI